MRKPLAIELFAGLGGFSTAAMAENYDCIGFDIERHVYGAHRYPAQLVIQDVRTIHGSQLKDAAFIWASPPCQFFSYCAMPWRRAKELAAKVRADPVLLEKELELFKVCFRIQREASEAAGHLIPTVVENVRGIQPWVGRARWNFGSFYLFGDVPALMPPTLRGAKVPGFRFDGSGGSFQTASVDGLKGIGPSWDAEKGCGAYGMARWTNPSEGTKQGGDWFAEARKGGAGGTSASFGSKSPARKAASAMIARIPEVLARHIARVYRPDNSSAPTPRG